MRLQGLSATLLRNTPANSVYLGSFEVMKQLVAQKYGCKTTELSAPVITACAGGSRCNAGGSHTEDCYVGGPAMLGAVLWGRGAG